MIFKTKYNAYFKKNVKLYDPVEFLGLAVQHIPIQRIRLIRYFGIYSSKSRGKWQNWDHVAKHAPDGWRAQNGLEKLEDDGEIDDTCDVNDVSHKRLNLWMWIFMKKVMDFVYFY